MTTSDPPLISVCMPTCNTERYVAEAVESILDQTLGDFEFLIEDSSTDGTIEILRRYAARDPRIRLETQPKRGVAGALNGLIDRSRGEFLARMDADDVALPGRFARQVEYLRAHPECVVVGSRVRIIDPEGDPLCDWCTMQQHEQIDSSYLRGDRVTAMSHPSVMMRRDAVLAVGKYRPSVVEDIDLFLRLAEYGRIANLPEVLLRYRIHADNGSGTASFRERLDGDLASVLRDARRRRNLPEAGDPPGGPAPPEPIRAAPSPTEGRETWAWWALGSGHLRSARKHARWVLSQAPLSPRSWKLVYCTLRGH
jgi:glycosyltransferase involved in cell wall biosynthesis